jgi:hypothetical protein
MLIVLSLTAYQRINHVPKQSYVHFEGEAILASLNLTIRRSWYMLQFLSNCMKSRPNGCVFDGPMAEHLVSSRFSPLRLSVCPSRLSGLSSAQIIQALPGVKYNKYISKCLICAAAGFTWDIEQAAGRHPYLCPMDKKAVVFMVAHPEHHLIPFTIPRLLEEVQLLKDARNCSATQFLLACGCIDLPV